MHYVKKLEIKPYLCLQLTKKLVFYLTELRISAQQMYVETDRYCNPVVPRENRFCFHCKIKNWIDRFQLGHISTFNKNDKSEK